MSKGSENYFSVDYDDDMRALRQYASLSQPFRKKVNEYIELQYGIWSEQSVQNNPTHCSFCGRDSNRVKRLIGGALPFNEDVYICNECVETCHEILRGE